MKILVAIKQVIDPDNASRVRVSEDGQELISTGLERRPNPFDEVALEVALRLTENGTAPRQRLGEVVVVTFGPPTTETMLRSALATGAERAILVDAEDGELDGRRVAHALLTLVRREQPDLIVLGKQTSDGDGNEVAQRLAALLDYPQATAVGNLVETAPGTIEVEREVDGGLVRMELTLPAVVSVELRAVAPTAVRSLSTPAAHRYPEGVRFAPLPAIMLARKKPLERLSLSDFSLPPVSLTYQSFQTARARIAGRVVQSPTELVQLLTQEAKVI